MLLRFSLLKILVMIFFSTLITTSFAQQNARHLKLDARKPIRLNYNSASWNKDPNKIEIAGLVLKDSISGRIVKIEMTETGPNTSEFVGHYQINFKADHNSASELTLEAYIAPLSMLKSEQQLRRIENLIRDGFLLRKPYFVRVDKQLQMISIYDSREQTLLAYQNYLKSATGKPVVESGALEAQNLAQKAELEKLQKKLADEAILNRKKMEEIERKRQEELKAEAARLTAAEKAKRQAEAKRLAELAVDQYKKNDFTEAEKNFSKALRIDPENTSYAYQYGVTLFQNGKFNEAIVQLKLANGPQVNPTERQFYQGLSHLKLNESEQAASYLEQVKSAKNEDYSPLAAFYLGVIQFQSEKYDPAKENFEYVLDASKDPKMDEQAEAYIEQIANIKKFEELRKKKFLITLNLGFSYDSNILSTNSSSPSAPTDLAGYRSSYGGSLEYRPIFSEHHEFSGLLAMSDMYSLNKNFQAESQFQNTDPLVLNFSLPYKWKGIALGKGAQLGLTPAYETIQMNADGSNPRETIVNSTILKADGTFVMKEDWFSNYSLEFRNDNSQISSAADDDQTATKITTATTQTFFLDNKKTRAWIGEGSLALNAAKGKNQTFNKIDLAGSYMMPWRWETNFLTRLSLGTSQYPSHTTGRNDTALGLSFILQKQFTEHWSGNSLFSYTKNTSSISTNTYDKFLIMAGISWNGIY